MSILRGAVFARLFLDQLFAGRREPAGEFSDECKREFSAAVKSPGTFLGTTRTSYFVQVCILFGPGFHRYEDSVLVYAHGVTSEDLQLPEDQVYQFGKNHAPERRSGAEYRAAFERPVSGRASGVAYRVGGLFFEGRE